ncbi:MAG: magnesium/cobalt efflux protein, partial [Parvibaculum sp.]|nr:magnesium/cobalt efflux protein [Parvibaculum sp.]
EYGGTDGLVSIEDLIEPIVGEIEDEHDADNGPALVRCEDGSIDADARCPIEDLEEMTGLHLVDDENEDDVDTLAGLVFALLGRVPLRGELVHHPAGIEFEVKDADPRRIKRMQIHLLNASGESGASQPDAEG